MREAMGMRLWRGGGVGERRGWEGLVVGGMLVVGGVVRTLIS